MKTSRCGLLAIAFLVCCAFAASDNVPCNLRQTKYGGVCICSATYCDYLDDPTPENEAQFIVVSSSRAGLRFETTEGVFNLFKKHYVFDFDQRVSSVDPLAEATKNERAASARSVRLNIDRVKHYQKIVGFGGSFTGAVSYLLQHLPEDLQDHIYKSYYAQEGLGFNLMRLSIGGCDFDLAPWAYNEEPQNDLELSNFNELDDRDLKKVQQIKRLKEITKVENLRIKGAAWSPPRWMKTNDKWTGFGQLKKEYYQTWADYHLKWLELMEKNGLPIWAISTGNEPLNGIFFMYFVKFMSLGWTPKRQAVWVSDNLGPTLRNSKYKDIILLGNDDQYFTFPYWFHMMKASRSDSVDYIDGFAVHWYWNEILGLSWTDKAHAEMPEKIMLTTEACIGDKPWQKAAPQLGSWQRAEKYARAIIQDMEHNFNGFIDWNIILDEKGGPNYVDNFVDAPIIMNMTNTDEIMKQPMFYTIGHFSKFVPEGSVRIDVARSNINVDTVAFLRPDGSVAVIVFNSGNANVEVNFADTLRGTMIINVPARSMHTIIYK